MRELRLDYQDHAQPSLAGVVLLALAVLGVMLTGSYYLKLSERAAQAIVPSGGQVQRGQTAAERSDLVREVADANEVLRQLSIPWESLFKAVEASGANKVTLLALEPDIAKHQVKISGETRNYKALTQYIARLQEQPVLGAVYLQSHQVQQQDEDKPVRFSLLATWREKS